MKKSYNNIKIKRKGQWLAVYLKIASALFILQLCACKKFVQVSLPESKIPGDLVFSDPIIATSAVTGMYVDMLQDDNFASGTNQSVTALAGLSADELVNYDEDPAFTSFQENMLAPGNSNLLTFWNSFYKIIYEANAILEGIENSSALPGNVKDQLNGECLFIRAFCYFYLVNTFGGVPITTSTDYETNGLLPRAEVEDVYTQALNDAIRAQTLLREEYPTTSRTRPNRGAATALLARIYLYRNEWAKAIIESSKVIDAQNYQLEDDLNDVFLTSSKEAIWQLGNISANFNTKAGYFFIINNFPRFNILRPTFKDAFESRDLRYASWVGVFTTDADSIYYPYKYKKYAALNLDQGEQVTEYSMVLRLAEQFLIRAEAKAQSNDLVGAIKDVDKVRVRAGLLSLEQENPNINKEDLLAVIANERRLELFTEWGHRWYDLKRTGKATDVLSLIKPNWNAEDVLYPIPQIEFARNPNLGDQNAGY